MGKGIHQDTFNNYEIIVGELKRREKSFTQETLAKKLDLHPNTVGRIVNLPPFNTAFRKSPWGVIQLTGKEPDLTTPMLALAESQLPLSEQLARLSKLELIELFVNSPQMISHELYWTADLQAALEGTEKASKLHSGPDPAIQFVEVALGHALNTLRNSVLKIEKLPNHGKPEWWLDYTQEKGRSEQ